MTALLLVVAFALILGGALLFTNAVEWLGHRLGLGAGAVGSVLAAVATALPESLIPIAAIVRGAEDADDVAIGAIVGAPFMLATVALALIGVSALAFRGRREQGRALSVDRPTLRRDLVVFGVFAGLALALGVGAPLGLRIALAIGSVAAYCGYLAITLRSGGELIAEEELEPLRLDPSPKDPPPGWLIVGQFAAGLGSMVGGAHLFVEQLLAAAEALGVEPLVLSLLLAPLATELPEKANSVLWVREGKDALALGNVTGAMVFQSTVPVAIGILFTDWELDRYALLALALALAGAAVALWTLLFRRRFTLPAIAAWGGLFAAFVLALSLGGA